MNKFYVLVYQDGSLAGIDFSSGGYPYKAYDINHDTTLTNVKFYSINDLKSAQRYVEMFPQLTIKEFYWEIK